MDFSEQSKDNESPKPPTAINNAVIVGDLLDLDLTATPSPETKEERKEAAPPPGGFSLDSILKSFGTFDKPQPVNSG